MITIQVLEEKIRQQAGEIEILNLQCAGYRNDIETLQARIAELAPSGIPTEPPEGIVAVPPPNRAARRSHARKAS